MINCHFDVANGRWRVRKGGSLIINKVKGREKIKSIGWRIRNYFLILQFESGNIFKTGLWLAIR